VWQVADRDLQLIFHVTESNRPNEPSDVAIGGGEITKAAAGPIRSAVTSDHCIDGHEL